FEDLHRSPKGKRAPAEELIASMEADGVDLSVTFPFGWSDPGLVEECNSYIMQAMRDYPGRIAGLAAVQPLAGLRAIAELERCAQAGMRGFGGLLPHGQGYRLSGTPLPAPLGGAAQPLGMFALTHA